MKYPRHIIWDFKNNDIKIIYEFKGCYEMDGFSFIYLKKQNKILMSGGFYSEYIVFNQHQKIYYNIM